MSYNDILPTSDQIIKVLRVNTQLWSVFAELIVQLKHSKNSILHVAEEMGQNRFLNYKPMTAQ
jgi:hypothetical protein